MRYLLLACLGGLIVSETSRAELPPLIPREVLFGNPEKTSPTLSPDGSKLAYLAADKKNVLQVWVGDVGKDNAAPITEDPKRGIRQYFWAYDSKHLMYLQDAEGDENFHVFAVNVGDKKTRDLTPFKGVRAQGVELDENFPTKMVVSLNKRDKALFDAHEIDIATGAEKLVAENPGAVLGWVVDEKFVVRGATAITKEGGFDVMIRDAADKPWRKVASAENGEQLSAVGFGPTGNDLYLLSNHKANATRLLKLDVATNKETVIAEDKEYDVSGVLTDHKKRTVLAAAFTRARTEWKVLDDSVAADFKYLAEYRQGDFTIVSRTLDDKTWLVSYSIDTGATTFHTYDRPTKKATLLFSTNSKLEKLTLSKMEPIEFKAKDGLNIRGYLTKPVGIEAKNLPTVLLVHGGPWARDSWGYNPMVQWLANRGYAVLQLNFRGSTGYGKEFLNAGNKEWAGKMHQDLLDGVDFVVKQGVTDPKKVAIMGGSYGGYATLVGLAFTPDVFACGVDIVGPSNIISLLNTIPPYWAPMKAMFNTRVGDLSKDAEMLKERSPLFKANAITKPLLIGQGKNDPRVKQTESDQIVEEMRKNKKEVAYIVYPDEGHGFARPENRMHFNAVTEEFLAKHLGGRKEPIGEIKGHTGEVK